MSAVESALLTKAEVYFLDQASDLTRRFAVLSESLPGLAYVLLVTGGRVACPCLGFNYRGTCRHSRLVLAHLAERQVVCA